MLALGGIVQRVIAIGRLALGLLFSMDGLSTGLLASGRLARGGIAAGGGAIGGVACGYSAVGSGAAGTHVIDSMRQDLEAVCFFNEWLLFPQNALNRRLGG